MAFRRDICQKEQLGDEYSLAPDQNTSVSRPHVTCKLHLALRFRSVVSMLVFVLHDLCPAKWHRDLTQCPVDFATDALHLLAVVDFTFNRSPRTSCTLRTY